MTSLNQPYSAVRSDATLDLESGEQHKVEEHAEEELEGVEEDFVRAADRMHKIINFLDSPLKTAALSALILAVEFGFLYLTDTLDDFIAYMLRRLETALMVVALLLPLIGKLIHHYKSELAYARLQVKDLPPMLVHHVGSNVKASIKAVPKTVVHGVKTEIPAAIMLLLKETMDFERMIGPKLEQVETKIVGAVKEVPPILIKEIKEIKDIFNKKMEHMKDGLKHAGTSVASHAHYAGHGETSDKH